MLAYPNNIRQDIVKLVPSFLVNEICCFAFYDNHPLDSRKIDITVCTLRGEVNEYYQREVVNSILLDLPSTAKEIRLIRNSNNDLFYLLRLEGDIVILSRKNSMQVHKKIKNVESFDVNDGACRGQAYLKVVCKDDAIPLIFDDNFECLGDTALGLNQLNSSDIVPFMVDLRRKLSEAKYNVKCLEKSYCELKMLRHCLTFTSYEKLQSNLADGLYECDSSAESPLELKTHKPWVKLCNEKIIIILEMQNKSNLTVENIYILLHRTVKSALVYTTKLFETSSEMPYWKEQHTKRLTTNSKSAVVAIIDRIELKNSITSKVEFNAVICCTVDGKEYLLPIEDVTISAMDSMSDNFNALSNLQKDEAEYQYTLLTILASSEKIDLRWKHIKNGDEPDLNLKNLFCEYLGMDCLPKSNLVVHRSSPYHILHGVMVVPETDSDKKYLYKLSVFARSSCQVLALIHYIHHAIPHRIVVTTPNQIITAKSDELATYNEENPRKTTSNTNLFEYGRKIVDQTSIVLDYLDKCMMKMNESKNPSVHLKVGSEIDVIADDVSGFLGLKRKLLQ